MKKKGKTWLKRWGGSVLAFLMLAALAIPSVSVKAAGTVTTGAQTGGQINMTKVLQLSQKDAPVDEVYRFSMAKGTVTDAPEGTQVPDITNAEFTLGGEGWKDAVASGQQSPVTKTLTGTWNPGITFSEIGIYTYTITETAGTNTGVTYDKSEYQVKYTVVREENGELKILSTAIRQTKDSTGATMEAVKKSPEFTNKKQTADLRIDKDVTGSLGDKTKEFSFQLTVNGDSPQGTYTYQIYESNGTPASGKSGNVKSNEQTAFTLKDGQYLVVSYLPVGTNYSIIESSEGITDYTTTIDNKGTKGQEITGSAERKAEGSITEGENQITFTNDKEGEEDTGIFMDILPFAVIVLAAVVLLAVVATRKVRGRR